MNLETAIKELQKWINITTEQKKRLHDIKVLAANGETTEFSKDQVLCKIYRLAKEEVG